MDMTIEEALRIVAEYKEETRKIKRRNQHREYMREYYAANKDKINEKRRIRRQNDKTPDK